MQLGSRAAVIPLLAVRPGKSPAGETRGRRLGYYLFTFHGKLSAV